jgi:hypothetical protein
MGRESSCQQRLNVDVRVEIIDAYVTWPYVTQNVADFLEETLPLLFEDVHLHVGNGMWFQDDGAPPHLHIEFPVSLIITFKANWLGTEVRSPGLHVLPIWPHLLRSLFVEIREGIIYATKVMDRYDLINRTGSPRITLGIWQERLSWAVIIIMLYRIFIQLLYYMFQSIKDHHQVETHEKYKNHSYLPIWIHIGVHLWMLVV